MPYIVTVNYGPKYNDPQFKYSRVENVEWYEENWLRISFSDGAKTLLNASKCYSVDIEPDLRGN